jgi:hypothetical protein
VSNAEADFALWATGEGWSVTKRGWPDFLCRRDDAVIAVEVKDGNDGLSAEQHTALTDLNRAGIPTYLWTRHTGLRPYPKMPSAESLHGLALRVLELEAQLRTVIEDRDRLIALTPQVPIVPRPPKKPSKPGERHEPILTLAQQERQALRRERRNFNIGNKQSAVI